MSAPWQGKSRGSWTSRRNSVLRIKIIVVDRTRSAFLRDGEELYLRRLRKYARIQWVEVKPVKIGKGLSDMEIMAAEGERLLRRIEERDRVVALDRTGKMVDSRGFASRVEAFGLRGERPAFAIGGPLGLSSAFLKRAHETLSLSRLTLTHEMTRLLLLEQLYRAFTILKGENYHK